MRDTADEEQDGFIAETQGMSYVEAQEYVHGDREELDMLDRVVEPEVGRAWIAHARDCVNPLLRPEHVETIREWYAEEVRQLNHDFENGNGGDMPVPVSARKVQDTIRFAVAFARVNLRDEVSDADVERAMSLAKSLVGQTFDGDAFQPEVVKTVETTQKDRKERIKDALDSDGAQTAAQVAAKIGGVAESTAAKELEEMAERGDVIRPSTGEYRGIN